MPANSVPFGKHNSTGPRVFGRCPRARFRVNQNSFFLMPVTYDRSRQTFLLHSPKTTYALGIGPLAGNLGYELDLGNLSAEEQKDVKRQVAF
jgi:hypothetical protein